jgi:hypothetical protein
MRCVLHHRDAPKLLGWQHHFHEPVLNSQREELFKTPRVRIGKLALEKHDEKVAEPFRQWRQKRDEQLKEQ